MTDKWALRLEPGENPDQLAENMGAENLGQIGYLPDTYLLLFPNSRKRSRSLTTKEQLQTDSRIKWHEQQVARWRFPKEIRNLQDPLFPDQWHLENTGQKNGKPGEDMNVRPAWNQGITGQGAVIAIVDDGLQYEHPDIEPNYRADLSYDFNYMDNDPEPERYDAHGTSAAGVAAARDDKTCGLGAAYRAGLAGLRLIALENSDAEEAEALSYKRDAIHIYSNSWGPDDDGHHLEEPGMLTLLALEDNIRNGRNGLGNIYVWAAGNGLASNDNINYDGYANSRFTIAVGGIGPRGKQADYSEPGAAMLVTASSDTDRHGTYAGITTTDLLGSAGRSSGDCRSDFGGTSAAAPLMAGIAALILDANPELNWRDVQHILVRSAVKNDPEDEDWILNGAGFPVNHKYGFGKTDTAKAVLLALSWQSVPEDAPLTYKSEPGQEIPDGDQDGINPVIVVDEALKLEHAEVVLTATHPRSGDLRITLTSPSGTQSVLAEPRRDTYQDYDAWKFMTVRNWGESSQGEWTLTVADTDQWDKGKLDSWELILHGTYCPLAINDTAFTGKDMPVTISVLKNDGNPDGSSLKVSKVSDPAHGSADINADNTVTYTPETAFTGIDTFTCTITDAINQSDTATITVTTSSDFAMEFGKGNSYTDCGNDDRLNLTGPLTIEAWIKPSWWGEFLYGGYARVVDKKDFVLYLNYENENYNDHSLIFGTSHDDGAFRTSGTPADSIGLNKWQHVAVTYDGEGTVKMYINGREQPILQPDGPPSGLLADNKENSLFIGESANLDRAFDGAVNEIRIWNVVRTTAEIQEGLYTGLNGDEEGLAAYWPVTLSDDKILRDYSGNGLDGTISGATRVPGLSPEELAKSLGSSILALKVLVGIDINGIEGIVEDINEDGKVGLADAIYILQRR
ncbi:S8 family serine peptidase [Desulfococcaceae bacterium HSG8]|nr:S8 family serine peptidase [Desulfococcaceae bacterium HSG8]